jgi:dTDP-4-dehydrorhamnose reductase
MKRTILLTGRTGQVGSELLHLLPAVGDVIAPHRNELDLLDADSIRHAMRTIRPAIVVNAAAYTAVDAAEADTANTYAINARAPAIFAEEAQKLGAVMVHYSTDYVFDGSKREPYEEADSPNPISAYGKTKLAGEQAIYASGVPNLIFRTAWVYATHGRNFLLTILRLATEREELRIVRDQFGAPIWSREIAEATVKIIAQLYRDGSAGPDLTQVGGVYHLTAGGTTTWYDFACAILEEAAQMCPDVPWFAEATRRRPIIARRIVPISTTEYRTAASRPAWSILSTSRLTRTFGFGLPEWRSQLRDLFYTGGQRGTGGSRL